MSEESPEAIVRGEFGIDEYGQAHIVLAAGDRRPVDVTVPADRLLEGLDLAGEHALTEYRAAIEAARERDDDEPGEGAVREAMQ